MNPARSATLTARGNIRSSRALCYPSCDAATGKLVARDSKPRSRATQAQLPPELPLAPDSNPPPIRIGVLAGEPIRLEGLSTVFEEPPELGKPQLVPVVGTLQELLA